MEGDGSFYFTLVFTYHEREENSSMDIMNWTCKALSFYHVILMSPSCVVIEGANDSQAGDKSLHRASGPRKTLNEAYTTRDCALSSVLLAADIVFSM